MATENPLTVAQLRQMERDLEEMKIRADEMSALLAAGFGAADQRTRRAQELSAGIQRLQWALERRGQQTGAASAGA